MGNDQDDVLNVFIVHIYIIYPEIRSYIQVVQEQHEKKKKDNMELSLYKHS